jgi:glycosyltransferase involved in cell wall biosynthesis
MDKKYRIVMGKNILIVSFTHFFGGGESFIVNIVAKISKNIFYIVANKDLYEMIDNKNKYLLKPCRFFEKIFVVKEYIHDNFIDIVILNGGNTLFIAPFLGKVKKIGIRHTLNSYIQFYRKWYYIGLLHIAYYSLDVIIHVSNISRREQLLFKQKSLVIYNGVKIKDSNTNSGTEQINRENTLHFLFIGRVAKDKGIDILINVFETLKDKRIHLHIVGSGELYTKKEYKTVTFYGFQTDTEPYYRLADYFISLPSMENCPFSSLDALSYGIPVITTKVGGVKEIIKDGYNGFFVKRSVKSVKKVITKLMSVNDVQFDMLSENARKTIVNQFNLDDVIRKYQGVIRKLCE